MSAWKRFVLSPNATIRDAVALIDAQPNCTALVVEAEKLLGTVRDTEVRKAMLEGTALDMPVSSIMRRFPDVYCPGLRIDAKKDGTIKNIEIDVPASKTRDNIAILMAGGPGQRLRPLTQNCPKPLLKVRGKPLLQMTLENLIASGFQRVYLAVNYKAAMVKEYFGDGRAFGIDIRYIEEKTRLGTAGALGLLEERPEQPFLVMNGDVVTKLNFGQLIEFHDRVAAAATMCVRKYEYQIPYGVVRLKGTDIEALQEKPIQSFFVNAGIYVLNPEALSRIETEKYLDMPSLFEQLMREGARTSAFPVREEWIDIGDISEYERAQNDSAENFVATINTAAPVAF